MAVEADLLQEFLAESWENLGLLDTEIVRLEQEPGDAELIASIFRTIHTLKGTCGFLGLSRLGEVAHSTENVLGKMRDRCLDVCPSAISIVLEGVDRIKDLLRGLEETGEEPVLDSRDLLHRLELLSSLAAPPRADRTLVPPAVAAVSPPTPVPVPVEREIEPAASAIPRETATVAEKPDAVADTPVAKPVDRPKVPASVDEAKSGVADLSIRVNVNVLDRLMNLVGELVLTRNQLLQMVRGDDESRFSAPIAMLNHVTTDLQEGVMKTRMQPIGNAWNKLPRLVRDLCQITGKQIELEMQGAETELDRTVLDAIKDPLTHMVRNSADHGIESPEIRRQRSKSEIGRIQLHAFHEGGHVIIRISDDGAGINRGRVLRKAIENGIVSEAESAQMSDSEILRLIFRAGFSTAESVTSISGRGVGMDVVRTEIERIGGTIELSSQEGSGTTVRIRIPLTLAIVSALVVESGGQTFAIPQLAIVELVRLSAEDRQKIERVHDREVYRLRDRLLPLVSLTNVLNLEEPPGASEEDTNIVVVQVGEEQFGLIVSEVFDTQEIVVKPVGQLLKDIKVYQGTTILGDGRVIMILDVSGIAATFGGLSSEMTARGDSDEGREDDDRVPLLLFRSGSDTYAVPLGLVSRLEEFPTKEIERSGDRLLVKYRGNLLQLVPIGGESGGLTASGMQQVVVFSEGQRSLGLMAEEIVDIVEEPLRIHMPSTRTGTLGTALVGGHATEVLDTQSYLMQADPQWFRPQADKPPRVLVADRSIFFRNLVKSILEADGYRAITVETTAAAIERLSHDGDFEAIVGEVLPPDSAGITLPEWVRGHDRFRRAVVLGLAAEQNQSPSQQTLAGEFDRVIVKFDAAQFRAVLRELMSARGLSGECA